MFAPDPPTADLPPDTLSVSDLASRIQNALKTAFPRRVWVVGEASELERSLHKPHWFFRLCEVDARSGKKHAIGAVLWSSEARRLFGRGGVLDGVIEPKDGIEIRALCDVDFYRPNGDLRLVVRDIDPAYTLGKIVLERRKLIERLAAEGAFDVQKRLTLTDVPLKIGLLTSTNSAAYSDFVNELLGAGLSFAVRFLDARMQGEETARTVRRGIDALVQDRVDVVCLIRGGGSTVDLAWFDREEIVRAIVACPIPVLCGIGHEIDSTISDLAAHASFKTPTAVAAFLAERGRSALRGLDDARRRLAGAGGRVAAERTELVARAERIAELAERMVEVERRELAERHRVLVRSTPGRMTAAADGLERDRHRLRTLVAASIEAPWRTVARCAGRLLAAPFRVELASERAGLAHRSREVERTMRARLIRDADLLEAREGRLRLLDPRNVLKRGYALLRLDGKIVKDAADVAPGDRLTAELRDGRVVTRVERAPGRPKEQDEQAKKGRGAREGARQLEIW